VHLVAYEEAHLPAVIRLCAAEGWPSLASDPERARRSLAAPGVIAVVAVDGDEVVGFASLLTDGEIETYLATLVVAAAARGQGVGRQLVEESFARAGVERMDVLSLPESEDFYRTFPHRPLQGFRLYASLGEAALEQ
jgi:ribosomal protein S18 acetylase RimI-like enzyme